MVELHTLSYYSTMSLNWGWQGTFCALTSEEPLRKVYTLLLWDADVDILIYSPELLGYKGVWTSRLPIFDFPAFFAYYSSDLFWFCRHPGFPSMIQNGSASFSGKIMSVPERLLRSVCLQVCCVYELVFSVSYLLYYSAIYLRWLRLYCCFLLFLNFVPFSVSKAMSTGSSHCLGLVA